MSVYSDKSSAWLLLRILTQRERIRFSTSLFLILLGTVFELVSLGLVIPVVQVVLGGTSLESYGFVPDSIEDMRYQTFVILVLAIMVGAFVAKNLFLLASNYFQHRTALSLGNRISQQLFENYVRQPYEYHLTHSSAKLASNIGEYSGAVLFFLGPSLVLLGDLLAGVAFFVFLLIIQPFSTLTVMVLFGFSSWLILRFTRPRARVWGEERIAYRAAINTALLSGFGGVKEIKLFGRDREVVDTHKKSIYGNARTVYLFNVISQVPRAFFEVIAVGSVAVTIVISKLTNPTSDDAVLVVALFGVAAFRLLPSINRVVVSLQQIALTRPGLEGAVEGLALVSKTEPTKTTEKLGTFEHLQLNNLKYTYPNTDKIVLNIDYFAIAAGESIGVVGSSGSGKSTLVDVLIGILPPTDGVVTVNGHDIAGNYRQWQDQIGYVPQFVYLMDTTIRRNVAFGLPEKMIDDAHVERALKQAHLWDFVQTLPEGWNTEVGERAIRLSGGQRQRLGIARALYANPQVIVLDEATSALDDATEREIVESFSEIAVDHTLVIVAHRTSTLRDCNRLIRLAGGRIVQEGSFAEVVVSLSPTDRGQ